MGPGYVRLIPNGYWLVGREAAGLPFDIGVQIHLDNNSANNTSCQEWVLASAYSEYPQEESIMSKGMIWLRMTSGRNRLCDDST